MVCVWGTKRRRHRQAGEARWTAYKTPVPMKGTTTRCTEKIPGKIKSTSCQLSSIHYQILCICPFWFMYLSFCNLYIQCEAQTHNSETRSCMVYLLNQPGAPAFFFFLNFRNCSFSHFNLFLKVNAYA